MTGKIMPVRRILAGMMAFLVCCGACLGVSAAEAVPDLSASGSISVTLETSEGLKAYDGVLTLYKVADTVWDNGDMVYKKTEPFEAYPGDLDVDDANLAANLTSYVSANSVDGSSYEISSEGTVNVSGLSMGLYLVTQSASSTGFYQMSPFLVGLPLKAGDGWIYNVDASPKMQDFEEIPEAETVEVTGFKTWNDDDNAYEARPDSITIELYADGVLIATKDVAESDGWMWSWTDLEKFANGTEIKYTIQEREVSGYTASYDGFNITNTYVKSSEESGNETGGQTEEQTEEETEEQTEELNGAGSTSPKTGDTTNMGFWMSTMIISGIALLGLSGYVIYRKKSERRA